MKVRKNGVEKEVSPKAYRLIYKEQGYAIADTESIEEKEIIVDKVEKEDAVPEYDSMKVDELKSLAKTKEIEGYSKMNKEELIAALEASEVDAEV